jgi:hypothetical protein
MSTVGMFFTLTMDSNGEGPTRLRWWYQNLEPMHVWEAVMSALLISYLQSIITPVHAATEQLGITKTKTTALEYE